MLYVGRSCASRAQPPSYGTKIFRPGPYGIGNGVTSPCGDCSTTATNIEKNRDVTGGDSSCRILAWSASYSYPDTHTVHTSAEKYRYHCLRTPIRRVSASEKPHEILNGAEKLSRFAQLRRMTRVQRIDLRDLGPILSHVFKNKALHCRRCCLVILAYNDACGQKPVSNRIGGDLGSMRFCRLLKECSRVMLLLVFREIMEEELLGIFGRCKAIALSMHALAPGLTMQRATHVDIDKRCRSAAIQIFK